ncbi:acetyltransferase [Lactobacillus selangorensis]|uniref:Acetyltransferase n=1 Tax=Lactobacillus selangorensis TaxID=81857 RepID=A0A0R2FWW5_9LACO|nr:GNAT family N-acetyltransferase [Lactobacillus selangorensis]KRN28741.1 acetyltransferase [Lactobacillus selangorensis]KRN32849.1 acetyltransferase [Lactobacillus selangorensis]
MASIYCRQATPADLPAQMKIIKAAKALLKADGSPQWQDGHPDEAKIAHDDAAGWGYVLIVAGEIAGTATLLQTADPNYAQIDGAWHTDGPYATIHSIAIAGNHHGQHLSDFFFAMLISEAYRLGFREMRIDTHALNKRMQHIIKKAGFTECGVVAMNGNPNDTRLAYDLSL